VSDSAPAIFLSYASEDAEAARRISEAMRAAGIEVWFDQSELRGGDAWDASIRKQIRECALFVPIISANTEARSEGYFRLEWKLAVDRSHLLADDHAFLLPLVIDETPQATARVPDRFRERQWARLSDAETPATIAQRAHRLLSGVAPAVQRAGPARPVVAREAEEHHGMSICVLPFSNMSGDAEQEYFSDGISEDIITDLSKVSALWVAARHTAFTFKGKHVDVSQVAQQLKVSHVLEGSVRKSGSRVRITAQLIDGATGGHVWAERYDRDLNDIFALQDEISQAIVAALKLKLLPEEKKAIEQRGTHDPEAYKILLMARQYSITGNFGSLRRNEAIIRLCKRAIEIDPNYAQPWAMMAAAQVLMRFFLGREGDDGLAAAERALALDDNLAEAHSAKARVLAQHNRIDEAMSEIEIALGLDPESYEVNIAAGRVNYVMRRFGKAIIHFGKAAEISEQDYIGAGMLVSCYKAVGDLEASRRAARRSLERSEKIVATEPDNGSAMGFAVGALAALGEADRAKEWAARAILLDPDNVNLRYNFACALVADLGEFDAALDMLVPTFQEMRIEVLNWVRSDPDLDPIREHPRFKAMVDAAAARLAKQ
jgi:adenylate cyclase